MRLPSHVTGLAFFRLLSCDKLKDVLLWTAALTSGGVASLIRSQVNKHKHAHTRARGRTPPPTPPPGDGEASRRGPAGSDPRESSADAGTNPPAVPERRMTHTLNAEYQKLLINVGVLQKKDLLGGGGAPLLEGSERQLTEKRRLEPTLHKQGYVPGSP